MKLINDKSPIIGQPKQLKVKLFNHQLATLYKCITIEEDKFPFGVLCDKAGSGKTAVILSLILTDLVISKSKTQNIIIVPQNIYSQWANEIKKFTGDTLKCKFLVEYSDILELSIMSPDILRDYDIILTTSVFYDTIKYTLRELGIKVKRLIFDEIDTINNIVEFSSQMDKTLLDREKEYIKSGEYDPEEEQFSYAKLADKKINDITWFVSASFYNVIDPKNGYKFGNKYIPLSILDKIICKCDEKFIENSFRLEEPLTKKYFCKGLVDIFHPCLSMKELDILNSLSFQDINGHCSTEKEVIFGIIDNISQKIDTSLKYLEDLRKKYLTNIPKNLLQMETDTCKNELNFNKTLLTEFHKCICNKDCENKVDCIKTQVNSSKQNEIENTKLFVLNSIIKNIEPSNKYIIFTDHISSFKIIRKILDENDIVYKDLQGGNIKDIDLSIDSYKNKDTSVLLIDSSFFGVGLNLENTTHIVLLHKTNETLRNQIIGRAQRPGRTSKLNILEILYENENV